MQYAQALKTPAVSIDVKVGLGIPGDAHSGSWHRQISLLPVEAVRTLSERYPDLELGPGVFAENILTEGIDLKSLPIGTVLEINGALLEVTQIGKQCHQGCQIQQKTGKCIMPTEGIFAKVLRDGSVSSGDQITVISEA